LQFSGVFEGGLHAKNIIGEPPPKSLSTTPDANGVITIELTNGVTDYAPIINAALREAGVVEVRLGAGTFPVSSPIYLPTGAHLTGSGAAVTVLQASADFNGPLPSGVVKSEYRATDLTLSDFSVDASKLSPEGLRLNGVFMDEVVGFDITRVDVYNVTGYAHFARGDVNSLVAGVPNPVGTSGSYTDCNTFNAQVHFEVMLGDGVTYNNVTASDGDGDISVESYFHPLLGSRNISYIGCTAVGDGLIGFSLISSVRSMDNISIIDCYVEIDRPASGYAFLDHSGIPTLNLQIENSTFISRQYIGFSATGIQGSATNSTFQGGVIGLDIDNLNGGAAPDFDIIDSYALALVDPNSQAGIAGIQAVAGVTFTGGIIEARGSGGLMFPASGGLAVSASTLLIQDSYDTRVAYTNPNEATLLFPLITLPAASFGSFAGGSITVTFRNAVATSDLIQLISGEGVNITGVQISYNGTNFAAVQASTSHAALTINLTSGASEQAVTALLRSLSFSSDGQAPGPLPRLIEVTITDGGGVTVDLNAAVHMGDILGGLARDVYVVSDADTIIAESFGYGTDEVRTALPFYILPDNIDDLTVIGDGAATLHGNGINNVISGGGGSDTLYGEGGADRLVGSGGADIYYVDSADTITELVGEGRDRAFASSSFALGPAVSLEFLSTTSDVGTDAIDLSGNEYKNNITGNDGANILSGDDAKDKIDGRGGDDVLIGGAGIDRMTGGLGADIFRYEADSDSTTLNFDWITDFGATDVIDLSLIDADNTADGNQTFAFIGSAAFGHMAGQLRAFEQTPGNWMVEADLNGDGVADFAIQVTLAGLANITATDFIV
jgi:Ca2+-binding RTX toxin-like protein